MWSIFRALKRSWAQHFISQASSLVILTLTYGAVFFIALSLTNIEKLFSIWGQVNQVTVYLKNNTDSEQKKNINKYLSEHDLVDSLIFIKSQKAAENFNARFQELSSQKIDAHKISAFFPEFYKVKLAHEKAYKSSFGALDKFSLALKQKFSSIQSVSYGKSWLKKYVALLAVVQNIGWALIGLFLLGSLIISSSVIKTVLFHRKDEVEILEFIGADDKTIYVPHIVNILLTGTLAFLLSLACNYIFYYGAVKTDILLTSSVLKAQLSFLSLESIFIIALTSLFSLVVYSLWTIFHMMPRQSLRTKEEKA